MAENLELDVSKALSSLEALDKKIDITISKLDKLYSAGGKNAAPKISYEEGTLNRQLELRKQIEAKVNSYQLQLSRGESADARRLANLQKELAKMASLGQLYAAVSEQARKVGENLGTSSLKFKQLTNIAAQFKSQMDEISTTIKKGAANMEQMAAAKEKVAKPIATLVPEIGAYDQLNNKLKQTRIDYQNAAAGGKATAYELQQLSTNAQIYAAQIQKIKDALKGEKLTVAKPAKAEKDTSDAGIQAAQASKVATAAKQQELLSTNELVGAYDRLVAKYQIAQREALNLAADEKATDAAKKQAAQTAAQYANQLGNAANAVNQLGGRAEKGIPAMYSFQQILLETPNAAMGMRTYMMSLSNNFPMFIMQMQTLAATTDLATGETLGWAGAFKVLRGSMGWVSLAMVAISTLAIVVSNNWDKWTASVDKNTDAYGRATTVLGEYGEILQNVDGTVKSQYSNVVLLGAALKRYNANVDGVARSERNRKGIIELTNKIFGEYAGKVGNVKDAIKLYNENANDFIRLTINMAVATKQADNIAELQMQKLGIANKVQTLANGVKDYEKVYNLIGKLKITTERKTAEEVMQIAKQEGDDKEGVLDKYVNSYSAAISKINRVATEKELSYMPFAKKGAKTFTNELIDSVGGLSKFREIMSKEKLIALVLLQSDIDATLKRSKVTIDASMDDLLATTKDKKTKAAASLIDFTRQLLNFDYASETLSKIKDYYKSVAEDENESYERRLEAKGTYERAARELTITANNKTLADLTTKYRKEQEEDNRKLEKNKKRIVKGANDEIVIYADKDEQILKAISDFNENYANADEAGKKELQSTHRKYLAAEITDLQNRAKTATTNEAAYLMARAKNLANYLNSVTDATIKTETELQNLTFEAIRLSGTIEIGKMEDFLKALKDSNDIRDSKKEISELEDAIARLKTQTAGMKFNKLDVFNFDVEEEIKKQEAELDKAITKASDLENEYRALITTRNTLAGTKVLKQQGFDDAVIKDVEAQNKLYAKGKISREAYEREIARIITEYQVENAQQLKDYGKGTADQIAAQNQKIIDKEKEHTLALDEIQLQRLKNYKANLERTKELQKEAYDDIEQMAMDLANSLTGTITELSNTLKDNYIAQLDAEQKKADESKRIKLDALDVDGLTQEEEEANARKKDEINDWYDAQERDRTAKKEAADKEAAKVANNMAIMQAAADLAVTIAEIRMKQTIYASSLASNPLTAAGAFPSSIAVFAPMYALAGIAGAMKIAALSAKKFANGGNVDSDMMAWVGDANKHEYGVTKEGNIFMTPDTPTLVPLAKDTVIYKDQATFLSKYINPRVNSNISRENQLSYKRELTELTGFMKKIEKNTRRQSNKGNRYYEYIR